MKATLKALSSVLLAVFFAFAMAACDPNDIFNPDDSQTWDDVVTEIRDMVASNIPQCSLKEIEIYEVEGGRGLVADIQYSVTSNGATVNDRIITDL